MKKPFDKIGLRLVLRKVSTPVGIGKATRSLYGDGLLGLVTTWRVFNCIRVKDGSHMLNLMTEKKFMDLCSW